MEVLDIVLRDCKMLVCHLLHLLLYTEMVLMQ